MPDEYAHPNHDFDFVPLDDDFNRASNHSALADDCTACGAADYHRCTNDYDRSADHHCPFCGYDGPPDKLNPLVFPEQWRPRSCICARCGSPTYPA